MTVLWRVVEDLFFVSGVEDGVGNDQTRYRCAADDVGIDDFVDVLGFDASIPDCLRVDHHSGAQFTLVEAAGFVGAHVFNATLRQFAFEQALQFALAGGIATAARMACFALVHADENVFVELRHSCKSNAWARSKSARGAEAGPAAAKYPGRKIGNVRKVRGGRVDSGRD